MSFSKEYDNTLFRNVCVCAVEMKPFTPVSIYNHSYLEENYAEQQRHYNCKMLEI